MLNTEKLKEYEKQGYLFHGSPDKISVLKPIQPFSYDEKLGKMVEHGNPSVVATSFLNVSVFRSIVNRKNAPDEHDSAFGNGSNGLNFKASSKTLDQAKNKKGFVHVLDKKGFERFSGMEWRSKEEVKPIDIIEVSFDNLPENIELIK